LVIGSPGEAKGVWKFFCWERPLPQELRIVLLVIFAGAFGASIMGLRSLADYQGQLKLTDNWSMHYVVRPPSGAGVAFVFYLVVRGGFLAGTDVDIGMSTPFGVLALAALSGMFSEKAFNKLREVFDALFKADGRSQGLNAVAIEAAAIPAAQIGQAYSHPLKATGGTLPYKWTMDEKLDWLELDADTGKLSGTPPQDAAESDIRITVKEAGGATATLRFRLRVKPPGPLEIGTTALPEAKIGDLYGGKLEAKGGIPPYKWSAENAPAWLTLDPEGELSGKPPKGAKALDLKITVEDAAGTKRSQPVPLDVK
jgi:hypothetical protein